MGPETKAGRRLSVVTIACSLLFFVGCSSGGDGGDGADGAASSTPSPDPSASSSANEAPSLQAQDLPAAIAKINVSEAPSDAAAAFGSIWISSHRGGAVERIDPRSNEVLATVKAGSGLIGVQPVGRSIFTLDWERGHVLRIDEGSNRIVSRTKVGVDGGSWAAFDGMAWMGAPAPEGFGGKAMLFAFDAETGDIERKFSIKGGVGFGFPTPFKWGSRLWIGGDSSIAEIDPSTGKLGRRIELAGEVLGATVTEDLLWVSHTDLTHLSRVHPRSFEVEEIESPVATLGETTLEALPDGSVMWRISDESLLRISSDGRRFEWFKGLPPGEYASGFTYAFGSLWLPNWTTNDLWRVKLAK